MKPYRSEVSRLLAAAVVSRSFCKLLLTEPAKALERGFSGETFCLTPAERQMILTIVAEPASGKIKTVQEFALRIVQLTGQIDAEAD